MQLTARNKKMYKIIEYLNSENLHGNLVIKNLFKFKN